MKTIVKEDISLYVFSDSEVINVSNDNIIIGNPETLVISDCNLNNSIVYENVTPPNDWHGWKYCYVNSVWKINPKWTEP